MDKLLKRVDDMVPEERDKIRKMLREKASGEKDENAKVGWLYGDGKPENEEYLLGRRIDHHIDKVEEADPSAPGALFAASVARRQDLDMQAKIREDPLFAIKQREEDAKRKILLNPIKMKQLQEMVERNAPKKKHKKEKKKKQKKKSSDSDNDDARLKKYLVKVKDGKKKEKKKKKHKHSSDSDSDGSNDILKQYLHILNAKKGSHSKDTSEDKYKMKKTEKRHDSSDSDNDFKKKAGKKDKSRHGSALNQSSTKKEGKKEKKIRHDSSSSESESEQQEPAHPKQVAKYPKGYGLIKPDGYVPRTQKSKSRSPKRMSRERDEKRRRSPERKRSRSPRRRSRSPVGRSRSSHQPARKRTPPKAVQQPKRKLTEEDKEQRRLEMMSDAAWRDEQREKNVKRYKEDEAEEEEQHKTRKPGSSSDFINPLILKHANSSSLEDRIRRNRYNLQRTGTSTDNSYIK